MRRPASPQDGETVLGTTVDDFTALGDVVNFTVRHASAAVPGELIIRPTTSNDEPWRSVSAEPIEVSVLPAARQKVSPDEPQYLSARGTVQRSRREQ
jgi:hypothetical protein